MASTMFSIAFGVSSLRSVASNDCRTANAAALCCCMPNAQRCFLLRPPLHVVTSCTGTICAGFSFDWDREFSTTDPQYYKWTQWIFLQLFNRGLAYQAEVPVNWCPALGTVLANEEVIDGRSERGSHPVERLPMRQVWDGSERDVYARLWEWSHVLVHMLACRSFTCMPGNECRSMQPR